MSPQPKVQTDRQFKKTCLELHRRDDTDAKSLGPEIRDDGHLFHPIQTKANSMHYLYYLVCVMFFLGGPLTDADAKDSGRVVFDFSQPDAAAQWQIVNDGVMGGKSTSRIEILDDNQMLFSGTLSLENNGGFASVRSKPIASSSHGLKSGDMIVMRVKGDGRKYTFNLYVPDRRTAFSHQLEFQTEANKWTEIRLPVDRFAAHSFGRPVRGATLDPARVHSLGILLGDKRAGTFNLIVDWIKVGSVER